MSRRTPKILKSCTEMTTTHIPRILPKKHDPSFIFVRSDPRNLKKIFNPNELLEPLNIPHGGWGEGSVAPQEDPGSWAEIRASRAPGRRGCWRGERGSLKRGRVGGDRARRGVVSLPEGAYSRGGGSRPWGGGKGGGRGGGGTGYALYMRPS